MHIHSPIAILSMYDWPEVRAQTDALWRELREAFRRKGLASPDHLSRKDDTSDHLSFETWCLDHWLNPNLVLGQTCGLPFSRFLRGKVNLLGSPVYDIDNRPDGHVCEAGDYYSLVVAAKAGAIRSMNDIDEIRQFAFNNLVSQSGFRAMVRAVRASGRSPEWLEGGLVSGSHRNSIVAVAEGRADFAAIDAVSWRLATRHEPQAKSVVPIGITAITPGLPMISSQKLDPSTVGDAIEEAIGSLDSDSTDALGLVGFRRRQESDYAVFSEE